MKPAAINCSIERISDGSAIKFSAPSTTGAYRLFVTGFDKGNHLSTANIPVHVGEYK